MKMRFKFMFLAFVLISSLACGQQMVGQKGVVGRLRQSIGGGLILTPNYQMETPTRPLPFPGG